MLAAKEFVNYGSEYSKVWKLMAEWKKLSEFDRIYPGYVRFMEHHLMFQKFL